MIGYWWFVLIGIIISAIIGVIICNKTLIDVDRIISTIFAVWTVFFITTFFFWLEAEMIDNQYLETTYKETKNIISLRDNLHEKTNGKSAGGLSFFYATYKTDNILYYYMMVGTDSDGYLIERFNANNIYVFFDGDENKVYIETYERYKKEYNGNFLFGGFFIHEDKYVYDDKLIKKEVHIPSDSIQIDYKVDMK